MAEGGGDHGRHPQGQVTPGGQGSVIGTFLRALLLAVLINGTLSRSVPGVWQRVILGCVVPAAVQIGILRRREQQASGDRLSKAAIKERGNNRVIERNAEEDLKTRVSWLYYVEGMTQDEVARRVGLTRARVLRILAQARSDGTVQIRVTTKLTRCIELERRLERNLEPDARHHRAAPRE